MRLLVISQDYPSDKNKAAMGYVHTRNREYLSMGYQIDVVSFSSRENYIFEDVNIFSEKSLKELSSYDCVVSHAPNIRNHCRFIFKNLKKIKKVFFFIHGHEVLIKRRYYPTPYSYMDKSLLKEKFILLYDIFKVYFLKVFFGFLLQRKMANFIFVSQWMLNEFQNCVKLKDSLLTPNSVIIFNGIANCFDEKSYSLEKDLWGDVVSIRSFDGAKYCVDEIVRLANENPSIQFDLYGKGKFFNYYKKPDNLRVINKFFSHKEIPDLLNRYRLALMPTRLDAQGVMSCEMAAYGIPILTTDLEICKNMLEDGQNTYFYKIGEPINIPEILKKPARAEVLLKDKFRNKKLAKSEMDFIKSKL